VRNSPASTEGRGGEAGGAAGAGARDSPAAPGETTMEQVSTCTHGGPHAGAGDKCRGEGAAERSCCGLTAGPIPILVLPLRYGGVGAEEVGMKT